MTDRLHQARCVVSRLAERGTKGAGLPAVAVGLCLLGAAVGIAQAPATPSADLVPPPAWAFNDLACSAFITTTPPATTLRILGSQDTVLKRMLGPGDTLVISGGASAGLQPGQEYYVRRISHIFGAKGPDRDHPLSVHTAGWVRILAVDSNVATAALTHACEGILLDDYLEPFAPPLVAARPLLGGTTRYEHMGRILPGDESRSLASIGEFISVDRGSDHGIVPGQRFLVFRDKGASLSGAGTMYGRARGNLPLVEIGEVVVVSVRPEVSTVQVLGASDAIQAGDLIAVIR